MRSRDDPSTSNNRPQVGYRMRESPKPLNSQSFCYIRMEHMSNWMNKPPPNFLLYLNTHPTVKINDLDYILSNMPETSVIFDFWLALTMTLLRFLKVIRLNYIL